MAAPVGSWMEFLHGLGGLVAAKAEVSLQYGCCRGYVPRCIPYFVPNSVFTPSAGGLVYCRVAVVCRESTIRVVGRLLELVRGRECLSTHWLVGGNYDVEACPC